MARLALNTTYDFRFTGDGVGEFADVAPIQTNLAKIDANFAELFTAASITGRVAMDASLGFAGTNAAAAVNANLAAVADALSVSVDPVDEAVDFLYTGAGVPGVASEQDSNATILDAGFVALYEAA